MDLNFSLKGSTMSSSEFLGVYAFSMALGSLSTKVQHYLPVSLKDWSGAIGH